jgi:hypothetical protein
MISFLLFYWFFSSLFVFGCSYAIPNDELDKKWDIIGSILFGWILFPLMLGAYVTFNKK